MHERGNMAAGAREGYWRKWVFGSWSWKRPFQSLAFIYGCLLVVAVFFADFLIFLPPPPQYRDQTPVFKVRSNLGDQIAVVYQPAAPGKPTLLYSHGNAEDLAGALQVTDLWREQGFGVLAYDYPGYGHSSGRATEKSCEAALQAAWDHLTGAAKVPASSIVLVGRSVGGGPAVWLAAREPAAGLVLLAPFTSAFRVQIPLPLFPCDRFPNLKRMPGVRCPLLVIHGEDDRIIPAEHGRRLFAAHPGPDKTYLPVTGAGHNDLFDADPDAIVEAVAGFANRVAANGAR
jgi:hypothetical protein